MGSYDSNFFGVGEGATIQPITPSKKIKKKQNFFHRYQEHPSTKDETFYHQKGKKLIKKTIPYAYLSGKIQYGKITFCKGITFSV